MACFIRLLLLYFGDSAYFRFIRRRTWLWSGLVFEHSKGVCLKKVQSFRSAQNLTSDRSERVNRKKKEPLTYFISTLTFLVLFLFLFVFIWIMFYMNCNSSSSNTLNNTRSSRVTNEQFLGEIVFVNPFIQVITVSRSSNSVRNYFNFRASW